MRTILERELISLLENLIAVQRKFYGLEMPSELTAAVYAADKFLNSIPGLNREHQDEKQKARHEIL